MNALKSIEHSLVKTGVIVLALALVAGAVSYIDAAYQAPTIDPPGGNIDPPITLDDDFQSVTGGIEADAVGVSYGIVLPGVPPSGGGRTVADGWPPASKTADCHLEVRRVDWTTGTRNFTEDEMDGSLGIPSIMLGENDYPVCDDYLTPEAKAAGWASSGEDNCLGTDGTNCSTMRPSTCMYTRLVCTSDLLISEPRVTRGMYYPGGVWPLGWAGSIELPIVSTTTDPL